MNEVPTEPTIKEILSSIHEHVEEMELCQLALSGVLKSNFSLISVSGSKKVDIPMEYRELKRFFGPRLKDVKDKLLVDLIPALKKKIQDVE